MNISPLTSIIIPRRKLPKTRIEKARATGGLDEVVGRSGDEGGGEGGSEGEGEEEGCSGEEGGFAGGHGAG